MASPEAIIAAQRIVPQYMTVGSVNCNNVWMRSRWESEVEAPTMAAAEIIQQAIDAAVEKATRKETQ